MIDIIPAIDIIDARCVRLTRGDYATSQVYSGNPADMARRFADAGCMRLHVVDLDGARSSHIVNYRTLEAIATAVPSMTIDFGGGVKTRHDVHVAISSGAAMITAGSIAATSPLEVASWAEEFGADTVILGADVRQGMIATSGWATQTTTPVVPFIRHFADIGIRRVISTDISADGTLAGPSLGLYRDITAAIPEIELIASGGVGSMADVEALQADGIPAVIVGKAIYEGRITIPMLTRHNLNRTSSC